MGEGRREHTLGGVPNAEVDRCSELVGPTGYR